MDVNTLLGQEWQTLQNNHEQHEKNALLIKLTCLSLCVAGLATGVSFAALGVMVVLCWLQEGIFKTYQARLAERLLRVELLLRQPPPTLPEAMQLHSAWSASRLGGARLVAGYAASACRPTVAFPYVPLLMIWGVARLLSPV
jgi:hypothetical protein